MIAEGAAAFGSLKVAIDLAKGVQSLQTSTAVNQAISDILNALVDARSDALDAVETKAALLKRIDELEAELTRLKAWDGEKQRYEMKRYYPGVIAYALKPGMEAEDKTHRLCAACYQKTKKGFLQATAELAVRDRIFQCTECHQKMPLGSEMEEETAPPPQPRAPVDTRRRTDVFDRGR